MIKVSCPIPAKVAIAVSGGVDSMAILDFVRRAHDVLVLHYNHGTPYAPDAEALVREYCDKHKLELIVGRCEEEMPAGVSHEAWWREKRYKFFAESTNMKIITAHHLDDVVENWIFTSLNGHGMLIPTERDNYIRPFLTTEKRDLLLWCIRKEVPVAGDPSNSNTKYRRNYIRHVMMPHVTHVNPGIHKTIKKKVLDSIAKM